VPVRLRAEINGRLSDPVETGAYYIVGEAPADAVKHRIDALAGTMQLLGPPGRRTRLLVSLPTGTAPPWQRAVSAGHKNKDLPDHPAILDRAGAGSLAGPLGPADSLLLELLPGAGGRVLAPRAGGL
jgi:hypothetical protein